MVVMAAQLEGRKGSCRWLPGRYHLKEPHYVPPVLEWETGMKMNEMMVNDGCHATQGLLASMMRWMHSAADEG